MIVIIRGDSTRFQILARCGVMRTCQEWNEISLAILRLQSAKVYAVIQIFMQLLKWPTTEAR